MDSDNQVGGHPTPMGGDGLPSEEVIKGESWGNGAINI